MKRGKTPPLKVAAITDPGMSGKNNEDRYRLKHFFTDKRQEAVLAVVADGIGGHRAGEIAAELACEQIVRTVGEHGFEQPSLALKQAIQAANQIVLASARSNPQWAGMGSTCACALVVGNRLFTASVGDSRIYLIRAKKIYQLSRDHTWIQEAIDLGTLPAATAHLHPNAHVIRRYIGAPNGVQPDTRLYLQGDESDQQAESNQGLKLRPGDRIVICSDGLTDLVAAHEILTLIKKHPLERALQKLVQLANQRGGHDNITIVALQAGKTAASWMRWLWRGALFLFLTVGIITSLVFFYLFGGDQLIRRLYPTPSVVSTLPATIEETPFFSPATEPAVFPVGSPTFALPPTSTLQPVLQPTATFTPWPTNTPEP